MGCQNKILKLLPERKLFFTLIPPRRSSRKIIHHLHIEPQKFCHAWGRPQIDSEKFIVGSTPSRPHVRRNFFPIRFTCYMFQCLIPEVPPRGDVKSFKYATHPCKHLLLKPSQTMYRCAFNENLAREILGSTPGWNFWN